MASERYLLGELTPELRDAYEEHMFGCTECANDARFGAAFIDHAKVVLPTLMPAPTLAPVRQACKDRRGEARLVRLAASRVRGAGLRLPACARRLSEPCRLSRARGLGHGTPPVASGDGAAWRRPASGLTVVQADLVTGSTLNVPLPQNGCENAACASFRFDFYDSKGKLIWSRSILSAPASDDTVTIWLPGRIKDDSYKLAITGVSADGRSIPLQQQLFELRVKK